MFGLFKKLQDTIMVPSKSKEQIIKETIQEIHDTFDTEVDRLLGSAKIRKSTDTDLGQVISKSDRLAALGFTSTKVNKVANEEKARINSLEKENTEKQELIEAINYFTFNYPQYKFITPDSVEKICKKYNLLCGDVDRYIGDVPDKNLEVMEQFKIKEEDCAYRYRDRHSTKNISFKKFNDYKNSKSDFDLYANFINISKSPLKICAPQSDFDLTKAEIKGYNIEEIPDPVVLQPVMYKDKLYCLVVTAWGLEGSDELVVNQIMN